MPHTKEKRQRTSSTGSDREPSSSWPSTVTSRAERSRHAAKMRRDKEGVEITTLAKLLPYPDEITTKLDKGSIIRLTTSYLRMKKFTLKELQESSQQQQASTSTSSNDVDMEAESKPEASNKKESSSEGILMLQALSGFVIFISRKGKIFFISENVGKHLGVHQYEMIGNSVMEFIHADDHKELAKQFVVQVPGRVVVKGLGMDKTKEKPTPMTVNFFDDSVGDEAQIPITDYIQDRQFFLRMRSVMARRGTGGKGKVVGFRVVNFSGRLKLKRSANQKGYMVEGLVCLCRPIQPQPILEIRMDGNMFMSRHGLDMSFTFCDPRIITLIGYEPHELLGKTAYQFHNPIDAPKVSDCHSNLILKGSSMSKYYRFMGKNGEWVWMQTKATIIYNTNNVAQYVVCMNYVVGNDEGERHLLMEQMQKSLPGSPAGGETSGSSIRSPSSVASCSSAASPSTSSAPSPAASGGHPSTSDEPDIKMEVSDESVDVCQFIPEPVRKNEPILKPPPKEENISFAKLLQTDNLKPYIYSNNTRGGGGVVEAMDTSPAPQGGSFVQTGAPTVKVHEVKDRCSKTSQPGTSAGVKANEKPYSPVSDSGSSSDSIASVDSPPDLAQLTNTPGRKQLTSVQEDDENLFKDLLEITKNDEDQLTKDNVGSPLYTDCQNYLFASSSPDNLSQLLGSPSNASVCLDSPAGLDISSNDGACPKSPDIQDRTSTNPLPNCLPSGILAGLLNSKVCNEIVPNVGFNNTPSNHSMLSMSVTKIDQPPNLGLESALPDELADFSLDFCHNVVEQTAQDIVTSLGGNMDLIQSFETTIVEEPSCRSSGAVISEVDGTVNSCTSRTSDTQHHVGSQDTSPLKCQTEPVTPRTPISVNMPDPCKTVINSESMFPILVNIPISTNVSIPTNGASQAQPFSTLHEQQTHVTDRISKLDIKDNHRLQNQEGEKMEKTPLLHALLTGAEANPVAVQPVASPVVQPLASPAVVSNGPSTSTSTAGFQNGINGLQEPYVDSFDAFLHNINANNAQEADDSGINNNMMNQDDLTLLQAQEQTRLMLLEEQQKQQERLLQQQQAQQKLLEERFKEQLLQRKRLQSAMEMQKKLQVVNMVNSPVSSQGTMLGNSQAHVGMTQAQTPPPLTMPASQTVSNGESQKQHVNYPIPNLTTADIQRLQQQKLQQQQIKQQLILQQRQQQQLQQMQQEQVLVQQQQSAQETSTSQPLLLQQALLQQQQQQLSSSSLIRQTPPPAATSIPQFNFVSNSAPMSSLLASSSPWTPSTLVNGTDPKVL